LVLVLVLVLLDPWFLGIDPIRYLDSSHFIQQ
jgi:hypothetical protein